MAQNLMTQGWETVITTVEKKIKLRMSERDNCRLCKTIENPESLLQEERQKRE